MLSGWKSLWLGVPYEPRPDERPFLGRLVTQADGGVSVSAAVLSAGESDRFFGVPLARKGIQPIWLRVTSDAAPFRLRLAGIDPNYYPPLEAAYVNHFRIGRRLLEFGLLAFLFIHLLVLLPFKLWSARRANRRMNAYFQEHGIGWGTARPGAPLEGFVFTGLDEGTKQFTVKLIGRSGAQEFRFNVPVPGLRVDHHSKALDAAEASADVVRCDDAELRRRLEGLPRATTNRYGTREGDPMNLVVVGPFETVLGGFGARWDETETISLRSCWRTLLAFTLGRRYRYSPVSSLYYDGRSQDFALQKARQTINERLHLRLWLTRLRYEGRPVWFGQVSRDIGVRFTLKTWNLTTHKVDPDVDDARDYVLDYLIEGGHVAKAGYVGGAQAAAKDAPRRNLTGDPYFTDGLRAVVVFSVARTTPTFLNWA
jgi:hypothetical protein